MFERFSAQARSAVIGAQQEARQLGHPHVGTEHLLLALLAQDRGLAGAVLRGAGLDSAPVREDVVRLRATPPQILSAEDAAVLREIGIDLTTVLARIGESTGPDALIVPPVTRRRWPRRRRGRVGTRFTPGAKKALELSLREAIRLRHNSIGPEHILLGVLREGSGLAVTVLADRGISADRLRRDVLGALDDAA